MERCLFCGLAQKNQEPKSNQTTEKQNVLEKQIDVVFVLQKLLELPAESLEKCFSLSGGENPASWVTICEGQCQEIVRNAQTAFQEMCTARQKLLECRKKIQGKIRSPSLMSFSAAKQKRDYRSQIFGLVRESVIKQQHVEPSENLAARDQIPIQSVTFKPQVADSPTINLPVAPPKTIAESSFILKDTEDGVRLEFEEGPTISAAVNVKPDVQPTTLIKCSQRDFTGKSKPSVKSHKAQGDAVFHCELCDKNFTKRNSLSKHNRNIHQRHENPGQIFTCSYCDYTTNVNIHKLNRHIRHKHVQPNGFICDICSKKFTESADLRRHQATEHYKCSVINCGKMCECLKDLRDHQITCHGREVNVFQCPECEKLFKARNCLQDHMMAYHRKGNEEVYTCDECDKTFLTKYRHRDHMKKCHTDKRRKRSQVMGEDNLILGI